MPLEGDLQIAEAGSVEPLLGLPDVRLIAHLGLLPRILLQSPHEGDPEVQLQPLHDARVLEEAGAERETRHRLGGGVLPGGDRVLVADRQVHHARRDGFRLLRPEERPRRERQDEQGGDHGNHSDQHRCPLHVPSLRRAWSALAGIAPGSNAAVEKNGGVQYSKCDDALRVDKSWNMTILLAMFNKKACSSSRSGSGFHAGVGVLVALWCLLSLVGGTTRALCLDLGGECSSSSAAPVEPCHDRLPDSGAIPSCGACVDILVREDATTRNGRPEFEPGASDPARSLPDETAAGADLGSAVATLAAPLIEVPPQHPLLRSVVLRI